MTRYFIHLDNPDKFQYRLEDISAFNGAVVDVQRTLTPEEVKTLIRDVVTWCRTHGCCEYSDLVDYCLDSQPDWLQVVSSRTIFFSHYLQSARFRRGGGESGEKNQAQ